MKELFEMKEKPFLPNIITMWGALAIICGIPAVFVALFYFHIIVFMLSD